MKDSEKDGDSSLAWHAGWVVAVGALGLAGSYFLPTDNPSRLGALLGVALSVFSGPLALMFKRGVADRSLADGMKSIGLVFLVRLILVVVGLVVAMRMRANVIAFVIGFFGVYFVLQWIEINFILSEHKRHGRGGTGQ